MEHIAQILQTTQTKESRLHGVKVQDLTKTEFLSESVIDSLITNKDYKGKKPPPPIIACEFCGTERLTVGYPCLGTVYWYPYASPCTCKAGKEKYEQEQLNKRKARLDREQKEQQQELQEKISRIKKQSGIAKKFLGCTFDSYKANNSNNEQIKADLYEYAKNFKGQTMGFYIHGDIGTGKTHIASAIANHLLNQGTAVICMNERQLLGKIKQSFETSRHYDSESQVLKTYETTPLLIIDDMGKERATEWSIATIYAIIDSRYEADKPIIITSNYNMQELVKRLTPAGDDTTARAIIDRLMEMTQTVNVKGESYR